MNMNKKVLAFAIGASLVTGAGIGASLLGTPASAATTSTTAATATAPANAPRDPSLGGHMANGITETLLTGDTAEKVKAAALAAYPGATIERVENDAEGSPYEAHIVSSDGQHLTVKVGSDFKVTSTESGHGGPGQGQGAA